MPAASQDMLANRKATMTIKTITAPPVIAHVAADTSAEGISTPVRQAKRNGASTPITDRAAGQGITAGSSRSVAATRATPRTLASPTNRMPRTSNPSPSTSHSIPAPPANQRVNGIPRPSGTSRASAKPAMQPLGRGVATRALDNAYNASHDIVIAAINDIRHDDPNRSVDALKVIQELLANEPDSFLDNVQTLCDALMDTIEWAFSPPQNLLDPRYFRLVKHLIQTFSGFSSDHDLMGRLKYDDIYCVISGFSLRLVQADQLGGDVSELAKFMNLILIQIFSTPNRTVVFTAMFRLLYQLITDFTTNNVLPETEVAAHADLVLKCLWKRCKILDDDLRNGRLKPGPLFAVLEEFMQGIPPTEFRHRAAKGIALGDMPLRTVKTIIQRMIGEQSQYLGGFG